MVITNWEKLLKEVVDFLLVDALKLNLDGITSP